MKTCNILVSENGETWNFHLLDLEDVRMDEKVNEKRLFKNFLQLNTSIPKTISRTDRLRFFKEYTRIYSIVKNEKAFIDRLVEKSRERGVVYVSAEGVIEE
jgi:predicted nucleotidyltransferase